MFDVGLPEIAVLIIAALFVFGPERLPTVVAQAARTLRQIRTLAAGARAEIDDAIGPELRDFNAMSGLGELGGGTGLADLRDLSPRKFLTSALSGIDEGASAAPDQAAPPDPAIAAPAGSADAGPPNPAGSAAPAAFDADAT